MFTRLASVEGHRGRYLVLPVLLVAALALVSGVAVQQLWAKEQSAEAAVPLKDARMIIEFNSTAGDNGIQVFLDGEPWNQVRMVGPKGRNPLFRGRGPRDLAGTGPYRAVLREQ